MLVKGAPPVHLVNVGCTATRRPVTGLLVLEVAVERTVTQRGTVWLAVRSFLAARHVMTDATARRLRVGPKGRQDRVAVFDAHLVRRSFAGRQTTPSCQATSPREQGTRGAIAQHLPKAVANKGARR